MAATTQDRRHPYLRQLAQGVFEEFVEFLENAGADDVLDQMGRHKVIEDVMRLNPEIVPRLLDTLWNLRSHKDFSQYFRHTKSGDVVSSEDEPIAPCGRPWSEVKKSHLYATVRVYLKKKEDDWAVEKFVEKHGQEALDKLRNRQQTTVEQVKSVFKSPETPDDFREKYPGHGVYHLLKPYLTSDAQFKLVPMFAQMTTKQVKTLEGVLTHLKTPDALEKAANLEPDAIVSALPIAQAYAEAKMLHDRRDEMPKNPDEREKFKREIYNESKTEANAVLTDLIVSRPETLSKINAIKSANREAIHNLYGPFGDELWDVLEDAQAVDNAINCPDHIAIVLGPSVRHIDPNVSQSLDELQMPDIGRDLIKIIKEKLDEDTFHQTLSNEKCFGVWRALPGKFNNQFNYQHDAKEAGKDIRTFDDLKSMASGIIDDLKGAMK